MTTSLFILNGDEVLGPYTEAELEEKLNSQSYSNPLIWWRGLPEWLPQGQWKSQFTNLKKKSLEKAERLWKLRVGGGEALLLTQNQMFEHLKTEEDLANVEVWTEGYAKWEPVFQIHPIMDQLGISRRKHPRVPLAGTVSLDLGGRLVDAEPRTISEGGLGVAKVSGLEIGQKLSLVIRSPQLYLTIHTTAEVVYANKLGIAGLRFEGLGSESRAAVIEYVKKFVNQQPGS